MKLIDKRFGFRAEGSERLRTWGPLLLAWSVPVVLGLALSLFVSHKEEDEFLPDVSKEITIGSQTVDLYQPVAIKVRPGITSPLKANFKGTITRWYSKVGDRISEADRIFDINERPAFAQTGGVPFYRNLSLHDSGEDVVSLHKFLCAKGCPPGITETENTFTLATQTAVNNFYKSNGINSNQNTWILGTTVYFPGESTVVESISKQVGSSVQDGEEIGVTVDGISEGHIVKYEDESPISPQNTEMILASGENSMKIPGNLEIPDLTELSALLAKATSANTATQQVSRIDNDSFIYQGFTISAASPQTYAAIPGTAIYLLDNDAGCIFVLDKNKTHAEPIENFTKLPGKLNQVGIDTKWIGKTLVSDPFNDSRIDLSKCISK